MIIQHPLYPGCFFGHDEIAARCLMDIDNLQSANVPSCALISKNGIQNPATVFPVLHWFSPLNRAVESDLIIHLKRCGQQIRSKIMS